MKDKLFSLKSAKYVVPAIFALLSIISLLLMGKVKINYNISDYLDDETDTKISLGIMDSEFGQVSNIQVMIEDVSVEEAENIKNTIKAVNNVKFVNFDSQSTDYYKENTALFVVLVEGNEYSDSAKGALADVRAALVGDYGSRMEIGGVVIEKQLLREAIQGEIVMILAISLCLVALLMLFTAESWIEPLVLLAAAGVAVLLNMGTNLIFGEISYITNAVAAILQLALSMDYSIVLLHSYRALKRTEDDNERAMLRAVKEVVRPVSASALTTIAGLLALLFMSFTIGFDIGIVLMKSIVISAVTALTLLPAFLILFDNLMLKTAKKPLVLKGRKFCDFSVGRSKVIVGVASFVIVLGCVLNAFNAFDFTDSSNSNEKISEKFGDSGTLIVLYEKTEDRSEKEALLASLIESYRRDDGGEVIKGQVSYSSTVGQLFDVEKASEDLGLSVEDAELLFTIYRLTEDGSAVKLAASDFIKFALDLVENDEDAKSFVNENTATMLNLLVSFDEIINNDHTAEEFYSVMSTLPITDGVQIDEDAIKHVYGIKFFDSVRNKAVNFGDMLNYLLDSGLLSDSLAQQLSLLPEAYEKISAMNLDLDHPDRVIEYKDLGELKSKYKLDTGGVTLYALWIQITGKPNTTGYTVTFEELFNFLVENYSDGFPESVRNALNEIGTTDYRKIYTVKKAFDDTFTSSYEYKEFMPALNDLINTVSGQSSIASPAASEVSTYVDGGSGTNVSAELEEMVKQLYIMYYVDYGRIPNFKMGCIELIDLVIKTVGENEIVADRLPEGADELLEKLKGDIVALDGFLGNSEVLDYREMASAVSEFAGSLNSVDVNLGFSEDTMMGVYVKYSVKNDVVPTGSITAKDLLAFVIDATDDNELISDRINGDMKDVIAESDNNVRNAESLLESDNYSRILLTVNLPPESEESTRFVEFLSAKVDEVFGEKAYVAGEIATTNDLMNAFDRDNTFISIFTVISIFLIVLIIFKSLSLPIVLVAVIQGAIWIAMSISLVAGSMFFMSYIMSMCILMGATIDYGILLCTNYTRNRRSLDKKESLYRAVDATLPTVFTSGLILMVCGLVVGCIATQTSISSVGFLLFRGTFVSVVMVLLVLPAVLYLLDSFVMKFTLKEDFDISAFISQKIRLIKRKK